MLHYEFFKITSENDIYSNLKQSNYICEFSLRTHRKLKELWQSSCLSISNPPFCDNEEKPCKYFSFVNGSALNLINRVLERHWKGRFFFLVSICLASQAPAEHPSLASSSCSRWSLQHQAPTGHNFSTCLPPVSEVSITEDSCRTQLATVRLIERAASPTLQPAASRSFPMHLFYQIQSNVTSRELSNFSTIHSAPAMRLQMRGGRQPFLGCSISTLEIVATPSIFYSYVLQSYL